MKERYTNHERVLPFESIYNVRDLGGYEAAGGRRVKWGLVYRAGDFNGITGRDGELLKSLGLKTIVDFRSGEERDTAPDPEFAAEEFIGIPINAGNMTAIKSHRDSFSYKDIMKDLYRSLIRDLTSEYALFFKVLAGSAKTPLLFHCSAGKDRTGVAAALFLSALGVERRTVYEDYELSVPLLKERFRPLIKTQPELLDMVMVYHEYLEASFTQIDEQGGMETYLTGKLGVNLTALRDFYTE
ncbi:MAG: tyrosine-protein phosphatase [Treponema sp.]|jgi:protein-tyrosine phosphatase|nr:tyrosine-protein phosphatase [Treponema sp.]